MIALTRACAVCCDGAGHEVADHVTRWRAGLTCPGSSRRQLTSGVGSPATSQVTVTESPSTT